MEQYNAINQTIFNPRDQDNHCRMKRQKALTRLRAVYQIFPIHSIIKNIELHLLKSNAASVASKSDFWIPLPCMQKNGGYM
jgi:hypothetical protein